MIVNPSDLKINVVSEKGNFGVFELDPLPTGYGHTLGNSLKRVLLTSLTGAAITQVKIAGADHQFTTVKGVKEDIVEITLNLKKIRLINHSNDPVAASIDVTGPGQVTAEHIETSSEVEILNKDQVIATLSDSKTQFKAELIIESGIGYSRMEERQSSKIGVIILDAMFSPVVKANYKVEPTRFGKVTDLDKIELTVETDGSITPSEAVRKSANLLKEFYAKVTTWHDNDSEEQEVEEENGNGDLAVVTESVAVEELPLPTRTINALKKQGIDTLEDLSKRSDEELSDIKNLGEKSVTEIKKLLKKEGLR
jgi:DNA-directed RNA polymerase subunit alpha